MSVPVKIVVTELKCIFETDESGSDEPYLLVTGINLKTLVPNVEVTCYGPWGDVDGGETHPTKPIPHSFDVNNLPPGFVWRKPCWGLDRKPAVINNPDDVIFLVSLMENDDGTASATRELVKVSAIASLAASTGMSRADHVTKLIKDINGAVQVPTGAPSFDENIGSTQELRLSKELLDVNGSRRLKYLTFVGEGARYQVCFEISKG